MRAQKQSAVDAYLAAHALKLRLDLVYPQLPQVLGALDAARLHIGEPLLLSLLSLVYAGVRLVQLLG